ncbi:hypothetical protein HCUR_00586 [Holospora curviuscula]|uniref:Uncharacterized protein n=1 Tax=Holospora curviuscula TaxID=1082868 RepID=A0A2S5R9Q1_9PROT|nr:hypothetical protein HCUR_00586 [Holospora curviuscula]
MSKVFEVHRKTVRWGHNQYKTEGKYNARKCLGCKQKLNYSKIEFFLTDHKKTRLKNIGVEFTIVI